ncbi:hypothetical protein [Piscirickettsia litoralis]|uniref:Transposase n=1 Tax=Piscirickettsia litoralis TaxID=1891921 RepID=A0ABX3A561_9GAMM|nr:hypothetical protein [Piscirickettsia litoralis]ODN43650.1 hypothetical protein BGC07_12970 [Piscirickettsia litoralis]
MAIPTELKYLVADKIDGIKEDIQNKLNNEKRRWKSTKDKRSMRIHLLERMKWEILKVKDFDSVQSLKDFLTQWSDKLHNSLGRGTTIRNFLTKIKVEIFLAQL